MQKKISIALLAFFILSIFIESCSTVNDTPSTPIPSLAPEIITTSIIGPKEALGLMFGTDRPFSSDGTQVMITAQNDYNYWVELNSLFCFWEDDTEKCAVITTRSEGDCHICGVHIQGAIFTRTGKDWVMTKFNPEVGLLGSFGYVSKGELIRIGDEKYGIMLRAGYANQGYANSYAKIIAETENSIGFVFGYRLTESQDTTWKYTSELDFYPDEKNKDYYKIVVSYFGTDRTGKTPPVQVYTFSGTEFVSPTQPPTTPTPTLTPFVLPTSTASPICHPGTTVQGKLDYNLPGYINILNVSTTLVGEKLTVVFTVRDIPESITINRGTIIRPDIAWGVAIDVDNNSHTGGNTFPPTSLGYGYDFILQARNSRDGPQTEMTGSIQELFEKQTFIWEYLPDYKNIHGLSLSGKILVDQTNKTITISSIDDHIGNIRGITPNSYLHFFAYDYSANEPVTQLCQR